MFYQKIRNYSPFSYIYAYLDSKNYLANPIFHKNNINVKLKYQFEKENSDFVITVCSFKKKDFDKFEKSMIDLEKRILLSENTDYLSICKELNDAFKIERN